MSDIRPNVECLESPLDVRAINCYMNVQHGEFQLVPLYDKLLSPYYRIECSQVWVFVQL